MKARIREKINQVSNAQPKHVPHNVDVTEQYYTAAQVAERLTVCEDTIKDLMSRETVGVIRFGNTRSTSKKRHYVTERYSASAVERLIRKLERGEDPRYRPTGT